MWYTLNMRFVPALLALLACGPPDDGDFEPKDPNPSGTLPTGTTPTGTTTTGTTTTQTTTGPITCENLPSGPLTWSWLDIQMEEDFDVDDEGYALVQDGGNVVGRNLWGDFKLVSTSASWDASGIQVLHTGEIIIGAQDEGSIKIVDPTTGNGILLMGGMTQPNGLEIESTDRVYVSEYTITGRVRWVDPATGNNGVVLENTYMPNGLVLSPDEQTLYIGGHTNNGANGAIIAVDRISDDVWDSANPRILHEMPGKDFDGVEVDICGNIYTVEYDTGKVVRITPDGASVEVIADIEDQGGWGVEYNSLRWGNGVDGWDPTVLYVTNREHLFPVEVGIAGKPSPSSVLGPLTENP